MIGFFSLFLELLLSQIIPKETYLIPLFTLVSILFLKKNKHYYIYLFILGFIYDLFFTDIIFLHSIIYLLLGLIINIFNNKNIFLLLMIITIYQVFIYLIYTLLGHININLKELLFTMAHYYIINIFYYFILRIIYRNKS